MNTVDAFIWFLAVMGIVGAMSFAVLFVISMFPPDYEDDNDF